MNIVHLLYSFTSGGIENMLVDIINEQRKTEKVTLIIINNLIDESLLQKLHNNVSVVKIGRKPSGKNPIPLLKLNFLLNKINPEIIHCHNLNCINSLFPVFRKKAVLTVHDTRIESSNFSKYAQLYAISEIVKKDILSRFQLNAELIFNGIPAGRIVSKTNPANSESFRFVQISRLEHYKKGQHLLIEAFNKIVNEHQIKNIHLDFIGKGSSEPYLKELTKQYSLNSFIHFLGEKDRAYIYDNLHQYDLLIQPSIYEGFGLTVAEAMAAKVPVLVSNVDGPMEIIRYGELGFFFETENVNDLVKSILEIIANRHNEKVEKAFNYVISTFSIKQTVQNYLKSYQKK